MFVFIIRPISFTDACEEALVDETDRDDQLSPRCTTLPHPICIMYQEQVLATCFKEQQKESENIVKT